MSYTLILEAANLVLTSTFSIPRLLRLAVTVGDEGEGEDESEVEDEGEDESEVEDVGWLHSSCKERKVSDNSKAITFKFSNIIFVIMIVADNCIVTMHLFWTAREYSNFTLNRYVFTVGKSEAKHLCVN